MAFYRALGAIGLAAAMEVVNDNLPNVHPIIITKVIGHGTEIWPVYNITGQEVYDLFTMGASFRLRLTSKTNFWQPTLG